MKIPYEKKRLFPPGLEPGTFRVLGERDNHYTTETFHPSSGSSLICIENDMPVIRGVTSWGVDGCRRAGYPGVFARTSNFLDWIKDEQRKFQMEANGQDICDKGLASDCYNGCVKSHIPNWGSNGIMGTPIKGGSWECTEGANTCSYICDEGNQDTGITTRCDGGEWRVPNVTSIIETFAFKNIFRIGN